MVRETHFSTDALIYPIFVQEGSGIKEEISSMPGQYRWSVDRLGEVIEKTLDSGVDKVLFFGLPQNKDAAGSGAFAKDGIVQKALFSVKERYPQVFCITDVCMCEYTDHGHCGILDGETVDNDKTLQSLARIAVSHAQAGADMVAPSDMMDGRVSAIRTTLDSSGYSDIPLMSYTAKYCSSFYGPFRDAADSAPAFGDRRSYQMDWHNRREAAVEAALDVAEGADIIMVKPALAYLDVISDIRQCVDVPVAAYSVSGEYSMIKAAAAAGYLDETGIVCEGAVAVFRAGANILISYYAQEIARWIKEGRIG